MKIAVASCFELPEPDPDQVLVNAALAERGVQVEVRPWDRPETASMAGFELCLVRSTWNYYEMPEVFSDWVRRAATETRLFNPAEIIIPNIHKGYLADLAARGVPVVPTSFYERGQAPTWAEMTEAVDAEDVVIKPSISASSFMTRRFGAHEGQAAQRAMEVALAERDMMVQPYMTSVDGYGERSLIWIDGEVTHSIRKNPRFAGEDESVSEALEVTDAQRDFAHEAIGDLAEGLLYARVDTVLDRDDKPCVAELELIEPSLFFLQHPPALMRFVAGVLRRLS